MSRGGNDLPPTMFSWLLLRCQCNFMLSMPCWIQVPCACPRSYRMPSWILVLPEFQCLPAMRGGIPLPTDRRIQPDSLRARNILFRSSIELHCLCAWLRVPHRHRRRNSLPTWILFSRYVFARIIADANILSARARFDAMLMVTAPPQSWDLEPWFISMFVSFLAFKI
jgi:hypothetical protein